MMTDEVGASQGGHNDQDPGPSTRQSSEEPDPHRPKRPARWVIAAVTAALLVLAGAVTVVVVMNHRADVAAAERKQAAEEKAAEEARQAKEEAAAELAAAESHHDSCLDQLNPLFISLQKVDARLDVGLNQSELSDMVGDASIAYSRIDIDGLGTGTCLQVGVRLENAFNAYAGTVSRWNDCIYDYGCDTDALTPSLQGKWAEASRAIDKAGNLLDSLDPHSASYDATTASEHM